MQQAPEDIRQGAAQEQQLNQVLDQVRRVLTGLRFGVVSIVVQDGVVVQIERTEKHRLRR